MYYKVQFWKILILRDNSGGHIKDKVFFYSVTFRHERVAYLSELYLTFLKRNLFKECYTC